MTDSLVIREATLADGPTLSFLERSSPLVFGGEQLIIDRGDDYFAAARLMEDATVLIAEVDGEPAGAFCAALHRTLVGGIERGMLYLHHARILPRFQDRGIGKRFSAALRDRYAGRVDSNYWHISPANEHSLGFARSARNQWSFGPTMVGIETATSAGAPAGRPASPEDGPAIVAMLNAAHEGEELFMPYTAASLAARLSRAPGQYGWERLWLTPNAVVGVWPEGESITVRQIAADGSTSESRGSAVLDFGYLAGGEGDLLALLGAWCAWLSERGMSELSIFSSPGTRHWELLRWLGARTNFHFWTPDLPEPEGAAMRGLYVDHIYF